MSFPGHAGQEEIYDDIFIKSLCRKLWPVASAKRETIVVAANRCGTQGKYTYAGSSAVLGLGNGLVKIYNVLGRGQRSLLIVDTLEIPTYTWDKNEVFQIPGFRDTVINKTDAGLLDVPQSPAGNAPEATLGQDDQSCDSDKIWSPMAPSPTATDQIIHDQQIVQSRLNSNIEAIRTLQTTVDNDYAAQQESLREIRNIAFEKLSLTPIIQSGIEAKVSGGVLSQLVEIERHVNNILCLVEDLEKRNVSLHQHYMESFGQVIGFLCSVELVDIENVVEETGDGNE